MAQKQTITDQLEVLHYLILAVKEGLKIEDIESRGDLNITRRTLQRRLDALSKQGRIKKTGRGRATQYVSLSDEIPAPKITIDTQDLPRQADLFVPLSKQASEILQLVTKPIGARSVTAYNRAFLDDYIPNKTSFLSVKEKATLRKFGQTASANNAAGTYALNMLNRLLIDLSWNSSRLEGNTYSLLETQNLIEFGHSAEEKTPRDAQMILNHKEAIEFLVQSADEIGFNRHTILNLHAVLADNLLEDPGAAGRLRKEGVGISGSVYMPPEIPQVIEDCFDTLLKKAEAIRDPFEQAFFIMVQLPYLQPFIDVNKRVSRLAMNIPLIRNNLAPLSFIAVPDTTYINGLLGVYELGRIDLIKDMFMWAYEKSSARYIAVRQTIGEPEPFRINYRTQLKDLVSSVVKSKMDQAHATKHIANWAEQNIELEDQKQFIEMVENELLSLHEGNFARYRIRPSEFEAWSAGWRRGS